jgi:L-ascorbate metabolism protein UlaG (beta-lactamase superfamily)
MAAGTSDPTKGQQHIPRLDVLVNNVGGYRNGRHVTADGLERTFALKPPRIVPADRPAAGPAEGQRTGARGHRLLLRAHRERTTGTR